MSLNEEWHLTAEQIEFFDTQGYLVLPQRIPPDLLARLQDATAGMIARGRQTGGDDDHRFTTTDDGRRVMFRVDYVHDKEDATTLELLGSPALLGIAESLAGPNFVPTYESLVFKDTGAGAVVRWHQDAVHPRNHRIFNIDVYLDESRADGGALRVVPGSQTSTTDMCELERQYGWDVPGAIHAELSAGDVLVHDVMIVHGSEAVTGNRLRRTLYYEFRPAEQILAEGPWDREFIDRRLRLLPVALAEHARRNPDRRQFAWQPDPALRPANADDAETELRIAHLAHSPGAFCSAGSVPVVPEGAVT